jgi:hypothetical protein
VTKCNKNQSKGENKAPKIINTGKYTLGQLVYITYQEAPQMVTIGKYTINQFVCIAYQEAPQRETMGKYKINKHVSIIYQEDPQRIISNKENSLTIIIIKSINITYLFFKPINQYDS